MKRASHAKDVPAVRRSSRTMIDRLESRVLLSVAAGAMDFAAGLPESVALALDGAVVSGSSLFAPTQFNSYSVADNGIGQFTGDGAPVNPSLNSSLIGVTGLAIYGSEIFAADSGGIGEFSMSGAAIDGGTEIFVDSGSAATGLAADGPDLFVSDGGYGTVGVYTAAGQIVNASLISGLNSPGVMSRSGSDLFFSQTIIAGNRSSYTISEYTTAGVAVNASLITGLPNVPVGLAVDGSNLFVATYNSLSSTLARYGTYTVGEYTTDGSAVNAALATGPIGATLLLTGSAARLGFGTAPVAVPTGAVPSSAITVKVQDYSGTTVPGDSSPVTLSIANGPAGGTLAGTTTVTAVDGIATFSDVTFSEPGVYTLTAADGELIQATQTGLTVGNGTAVTAGYALSVTIAKSNLPAVVSYTRKPVPVPRGYIAVEIENTDLSETVDRLPFDVAIYASADGVIDALSTPVAHTVTKVPRLSINKTLVVKLPVDALPASLDGTYTLFAQAIESSTNISDSDAGGPALTVAPAAANIAGSIASARLVTRKSNSGKKTTGVVVLKLANTGALAGSFAGTVAIYASPDPTTADGILIQTVSESVAVRAGMARNLVISLPGISSNIAGIEFLIADLTDAAGAITTVVSPVVYGFGTALLIPSLVNETSNANSLVLIVAVANNGSIASTGPTTLAAQEQVTFAPGALSLAGQVILRLRLAPAGRRVIAIEVNDTRDVLQASNDAETPFATVYGTD